MKILLAVDGSECSDAAVAEVARRPWPAGSEIEILSAAEPAPAIAMPEAYVAPEGYYERIETMHQERAQAAVDAAATRIRAAHGEVPVRVEVRPGLPKEVILDEAERWPADLVIVGSHGYRGLMRLWLGSVSHAVATHARCSVEIVRCRGAAATR
jgi:nucleotide-binding universal stress UspA family protein